MTERGDIVGEHLTPLLTACRRLDAHSLSAFGSAVTRELDDVTDVDLHLVIARMDRPAFAQIVSAARASARGAARALDQAWCVELRHGPFKPTPDAARTLQLHVVADDMASLALSPAVLRLQRLATGRHLLDGRPPPIPEQACGSRRLLEACDELARWRGAIQSREIAFRAWEMVPTPRLVERRVPAATAWELRCLLGGAGASTDLHFFASLAPQPGDATCRSPLLEQLGIGRGDWRGLPRAWNEVSARAQSIIEERLDRLTAAARQADAACAE